MLNEELSRICVSPTDNISKVMAKMAQNKTGVTQIPAGISLIVDKKYRLIGIATDGDIRRALLRGVTLNTPISEIMNRDPFFVEGPKSNNEIVSLVLEKTRKESWHKDRLSKVIIVDKNKKVVDLISLYDIWQKSDVRFKQIGVVGLGYVGLTLALTLADLSFKVKGFDINPNVIKSLKKGQPHFFENGLERILKDNIGKNFNVVTDFNKTNSCEVYFIAVGTPLNKNKKPDLAYLESASDIVGRVLKNGDAVILRSTVPVGTTKNTVIPILEKASSLKAGEDFSVAFAPERTVEGKALEELKTLPQVVGGLDWTSADLAANIFSHITHSVVLVDSLEEAEMVKLINNTYRDVVFSFANELSLVCNHLNIDTHRVIEAANRGYDRSQVPLPSPGVGGVCLEKDPFIFIESALTKGYTPLLARDSRKISEAMVDFVGGEILKFLKNKKNTKVFILGFAFKGRPVTSDIRGSTAVSLVSKIKGKVGSIYAYDPAVNKKDIEDNGVIPVLKPSQGFKTADVVVVMNNNPEFEKLDMRNLIKSSKKSVFLFDTWGIFNQGDLAKLEGVVYKRL